MQRATKLLRNGRYHYKYKLGGRKKEFRLFKIRKPIVEKYNIKDNTKRKVLLKFSNQKKAHGFMAITSGNELSFPEEFQRELKKCSWFKCRIIGNKVSDKVTLNWK